MASSSRPAPLWHPSYELDGTPLPADASIRGWEKGEGGRVAQSLAHDLLLPADVSAFTDATDESMGRRLQWHTIAVSPLPSHSHYYHFPPAQVLIIFYFIFVFGVTLNCRALITLFLTGCTASPYIK